MHNCGITMYTHGEIHPISIHKLGYGGPVTLVVYPLITYN